MKKKYTDNKDTIYEQLLNDIITLQLKPGEYIKETDISIRFNTSRTPIREVFKKLANEKYIDVIPRHGNKVSLIDIKYVKQMIEMRIVLEIAVIKDIIYNLKNIEGVTKILIEQEKLVASGNGLSAFYELDNEFHKELFNICNKQIWWNILSKFEPHYMRFRKLDMSDLNRIELLYVHHKNIVQAIDNKDISLVEEIIKSHVNICLERIPVLLDKYPNYFIN